MIARRHAKVKKQTNKHPKFKRKPRENDISKMEEWEALPSFPKENTK